MVPAIVCPVIVEQGSYLAEYPVGWCQLHDCNGHRISLADGHKSAAGSRSSPKQGKQQLVDDVDYLVPADVIRQGEFAVENVDRQPGNHRRQCLLREVSSVALLG